MKIIRIKLRIAYFKTDFATSFMSGQPWAEYANGCFRKEKFFCVFFLSKMDFYGIVSAPEFATHSRNKSF
ncbi:hypothetical protein B1H58_15150 [Pantoea alhagi]|uniref:Uncharacterized protein n=1 Tax=Pantoea alhagi TaxID=1891675 RepID=A0A1W6B807_9GAMM|nr:hypothetical protein B1H58_15150 [Pantoea alhagi]